MASGHTFTLADVQACRTHFATQIATYRDLIAAASKASGASLTRVDAALAAFEPGYFNTLLVALNARFVRHASDTRAALGEVRLLVDSMQANGGVMTVSDTAGYEPANTVLGIDAGDRIALNAEDFEAICAAFLAALEDSLATSAFPTA